MNVKKFSRAWIVSSIGVKKDGLKKQMKLINVTDQHEITYLQSVVEDTPIGNKLSKASVKD